MIASLWIEYSKRINRVSLNIEDEKVPRLLWLRDTKQHRAATCLLKVANFPAKALVRVSFHCIINDMVGVAFAVLFEINI